MKRTLTVTLLFVAVLGWAENWPQWRGPTLNGISGEKNLPEKWGVEENITWKLEVPSRTGATPIIWGDTVFLNVAEADNDSLSVWAVDRNKGTVLWKQPMGGGNHMMRKQNMSSPSPVTDGQMVWALNGNGVLKAFDFKGKELWARDIQKEYGKFGLNWGYGSSPLLYEDSLYVQVLHGMRTDDPSYVLRLDKKTGKTTWRVDRPSPAIRESPDAYTTPTIFRSGKQVELIVSGGDVVTGHDLATGRELWRGAGLNPNNNPNYRVVASPVVIGDLIIAPTRVRPLKAFRGTGGGITELWEFQRGPDVPTPVTDGKYFYSVTDGGVMYCLDATNGQPLYGGTETRLKPATYSSSPVLADGKLYVSNEDGLTSVVRAGPKFEVIAENHLDGYTLSSPAISEGQIFLRTDKFLYVVGKRVTAKK